MRWAVCLVALAACGGTEVQQSVPPRLQLVGATINTGTTDGLEHDAEPDDGYGSEEAAIADAWYGNGLAWPRAIDDLRRFFEEVSPDVIGFQEMFYSPECQSIPAEFRTGFVCESYQPGDPTVIQLVLGDAYQIACHLGNPDKCLAVHERFGAIAGCAEALCIDGLAGAPVDGCGGGARVGRAVIELVAGGTLTVVNLHGTSGIADEDLACRERQFEQVFVDLGTGDGPAANGALNLIFGDLNTDPGRLAGIDPSAAAFNRLAGQRFRFITAVGSDAVPTYLGLNIDHVLSDTLKGSCWHPGIDAPPVTDMVYFDHKPAVCELAGG